MRGGEAESAWRDFFDRYAPAVYRVALLRGLSPEDADDIVQQVMLAVSNHIGRFEYDRDRGHFRQWVRRITDNKIRDWRKRRVPGAAHLLDYADTGPSAEEIWERQWRLQDIDQCLDEIAGELASHRVEAFRLYVIEGLSAAETAEQVGMTIGHVYVTRTQILKKIRRRMRALEADNF
jgi:RNA polymerase sigma-70 factor (ECF subfamily)